MAKRKKAAERAASSRGGTLTVCGLGIDRPQDATVGTIQTLKECEIAFYIHGDGERLRPFLAAFCADVRLCAGAKYDSLTTDQKIAAVAAEICLELEKGKKVAYVTYGHPLVFSDGFNVLKSCRARGYECRVLPAPSSVDSILAAVGELFETFSNSFVVCSADAVIEKPGALGLGFPVVLLCLDAVAGRGSSYGAFCDRLEAAYPPGHPVFAVKCRDTYGEEVRLDGRVADLRGWEKKIVHMMSLVVPAHVISTR